MSYTKVITPNGVFTGPISEFEPEKGYLTLGKAGPQGEDVTIFFMDMVSATTETAEGIIDELDKARNTGWIDTSA